jgi:hypothetical protein
MKIDNGKKNFPEKKVVQCYVVSTKIAHRLLWDRAWVSAVKSRRLSSGDQTPCLDIDDGSGDIGIIPWSKQVCWLEALLFSCVDSI